MRKSSSSSSTDPHTSFTSSSSTTSASVSSKSNRPQQQPGHLLWSSPLVRPDASPSPPLRRAKSRVDDDDAASYGTGPNNTSSNNNNSNRNDIRNRTSNGVIHGLNTNMNGNGLSKGLHDNNPYSPDTNHSPVISGGLRRANTIGETYGLHRKRSGLAAFDQQHGMPFEPVAGPRRASNFSESSLYEAREVLNPRPTGVTKLPSHEASSWASISLAFALLPALAGILFQNGGAVVTDALLLALAGIFLHWSVTQPWNWYQSAQEIRIQAEKFVDLAVEDDEDDEDDQREEHGGIRETTTSPTKSTSSPSQPPETPKDDNSSFERPITPEAHIPPHVSSKSEQQQAALAELLIHEVMALISCFAFPILGAYLLHAIRAQLSRPSEGLVSNYNLSIFLLVSELRVMSHVISLIQSRTLHLQRVVHANPFAAKSEKSTETETLLQRIERLEARLGSESLESTDQEDGSKDGNKDNSSNGHKRAGGSSKTSQQLELSVAREVRSMMQQELDALNRAVRRYEKKATVLALQTEARLSTFDARLDDAMALAAAATKFRPREPGMLAKTTETVVTVVLLPFHAIMTLLFLPFRTAMMLFRRRNSSAAAAAAEAAAGRSRSSRYDRGSKSHIQPRVGGDRLSSRGLIRR